MDNGSKTVVFDMDGVIFDTEKLYMDLWTEIEKREGFSGIYSTLLRCIGTNEKLTRQIVLDEYGEDFPYEEYRQEASGKIKEIERNGKMPVKPGAREILRYLHEEKYHVGLASSTRRETVRRELDSVGLLDFFSTIIGGDMVTRSKPEPDIFLKCCEVMEVSPSETFVIEDSFNGIRAAHKAGTIPIMVPDILQPDDEIRKLCHVVLPSLYEVRDFFMQVK